MCESRLTNLTGRRLTVIAVVMAALFTGTLAAAVFLMAGG
jgi:uncharacterized membrane protein